VCVCYIIWRSYNSYQECQLKTNSTLNKYLGVTVSYQVCSLSWVIINQFLKLYDMTIYVWGSLFSGPFIFCQFQDLHFRINDLRGHSSNSAENPGRSIFSLGAIPKQTWNKSSAEECQFSPSSHFSRNHLTSRVSVQSQSQGPFGGIPENPQVKIF